MSKQKTDFITISNWIGAILAGAVTVVIGSKVPDYTWYGVPLLAGFVVLTLVTFGLDWILRTAGGFKGITVAIMTTVSFVVAVLQLIIWYRQPPF